MKACPHLCPSVPALNPEKGFFLPIGFRHRTVGSSPWGCASPVASGCACPGSSGYRIESIHTVVASLHLGDFRASVDSTNAYLCTPICAQHQHFLHSTVGKEHFHLAVLTFGLASTPHVLAKMLVPVLAWLHKQGIAVLGCLDDLLQAESSATLRGDVACYTDLSWLLYYLKSAPAPSRKLDYLGLTLVSYLASVFLPLDKLQKLHAAFQLLLSRRWASLQVGVGPDGIYLFEAVPYKLLSSEILAKSA